MATPAPEVSGIPGCLYKPWVTRRGPSCPGRVLTGALPNRRPWVMGTVADYTKQAEAGRPGRSVGPAWWSRGAPLDSWPLANDTFFPVSPRQEESLGTCGHSCPKAVVQLPVTRSPGLPPSALSCPSAWGSPAASCAWRCWRPAERPLRGGSEPQAPDLLPSSLPPAGGARGNPKSDSAPRLTALWGEVVGCIVWGSALLWVNYTTYCLS